MGWCLYLATGASLVRSDENAANMVCIYEEGVRRKDARGEGGAELMWPPIVTDPESEWRGTQTTSRPQSQMANVQGQRKTGLGSLWVLA